MTDVTFWSRLGWSDGLDSSARRLNDIVQHCIEAAEVFDTDVVVGERRRHDVLEDSDVDIVGDSDADEGDGSVADVLNNARELVDVPCRVTVSNQDDDVVDVVPITTTWKL